MTLYFQTPVILWAGLFSRALSNASFARKQIRHGPYIISNTIRPYEHVGVMVHFIRRELISSDRARARK